MNVDISVWQVNALIAAELERASRQAHQYAENAHLFDPEDLSELQCKLDEIKRLLKAKEGVPS